MEQPISTLKISLHTIKRLKEAGFVYCNDLKRSLQSQNLSQDIKNEIQLLLKVDCAKSALDIWQEECSSQGIQTFSKDLDTALGQGIPLKLITELCGPPGSGKTQFSMQLCVDVQIPSEFGGFNDEAVFIDTNSGFTPKRLAEIGEASIFHCSQVAAKFADTGMKSAMENFTVHSILQRVHYLHAQDHIQLIAAVELLKDTIKNNQKIRLVIIDSFSFLFRYGVDMIQRTRILHQMLTDLQELADVCNIAVVITNEITTRPICGGDGLVPALGDSHAHRVPLRLLLGTVTDGNHAVMIAKSVNHDKVISMFKISKDGIRDAD